MPTASDARPQPGTIVLWGDIACPWASLATHRLHEHRSRLGLDDAVHIDHRAFALELVNERCTPKRTIDLEVAVVGAHEPALGWAPWSRFEYEYPGTVLLALAAVQAAKDPAVGGHPASEQLDRRLRSAFFRDGRPISLWSEIIAVAEECDRVHTATLVTVMRRGAGLAAVLDQVAHVERSEHIAGSPHVFAPDGTAVHNPGLKVSWTEGKGKGFPVIEADDPSIYDDLLRRAASG